MKKLLIITTCLVMLGCAPSNQEKAEALNEVLKDCPEGATITVKAYTSWWDGGATVTCKYQK